MFEIVITCFIMKPCITSRHPSVHNKIVAVAPESVSDPKVVQKILSQMNDRHQLATDIKMVSTIAFSAITALAPIFETSCVAGVHLLLRYTLSDQPNDPTWG